MQIDNSIRALLCEFWPFVKESLHDVLDGFYAHVGKTQSLARLVVSDAPRLKSAQGEHWERLFSGRFDPAYFDGVKKIGLIHNKIGLEPRWYIGGYAFVLRRLSDLAVKTYRWRPQKLADVLRAVESAVMLDMDVAISVYQEALIADRMARTEKLEALLHAFDGQVQGSLATFGSASTQLHSTAKSMAAIASQTQGQSMSVAAGAEEAHANIQTVATAAEQLARSVSEISHRVTQSSGVSDAAVAEAGRANAIVQTLTENAQKITAIVQLINDIASKTNLLALNATIEAARAGEAGRGFAVVANEVKNLASQTGKATDEIGSQIGQIQTASQEAAGAIEAIVVTIGKISSTASLIARAVSEQGGATDEIAHSVHEAAIGTRDVSASILGVSIGVQETEQAAGDVLQAAASLSRQSSQLSANVSDFIAAAKAI